MRMKSPTGRLLRLLAMAMLLSSASCLARQESLLEKGERVDTGRRPFDTYFEEVDALRDEVDSLDSDLFPMRQPLTEHLGLDVDASLPKLLGETRTRATKLRDYGVSMNLGLTPLPKVLQVKGNLELDAKDEGLPEAIQEAAVRASDTFKKYQDLLVRAASLEEQRNKLADKIDQLPPGYAKRPLIETEIVAAGRVLEKAERKLAKDTRTIAHFLIGLVQAVDTGATELQSQKCDETVVATQEKGKKPPKSGWRPPPGPATARKGPPPAAVSRPAPVPRPVPTRPAAGDFEM